MILRKPYAFFVKYFKFIHLIMAILISIFIYNTAKIMLFLDSYIKDYTSIMGSFNLGEIINVYTFIVSLVVVVFNIIVLSVMYVKKKTKVLYVYNLILYFFTLIFFMICFNVLKDVNTTILDIRVTKAFRDISVGLLFLEFVSVILVLIRATGFDIKKFDFVTDIQNLEIDEKDSEEIEVAIEFDKNRIQRKFRYFLRNFRYNYVEHKFIINISLIIILLIGAFLVYFNKSIYEANYRENKYFSASGISMKINDSFLIENDYYGNKITNNKLVVVRFDVKRNSVKQKKLNTGLINLRVNGKSYNQTSDYNAKLADLGIGYTDQKLTDEYKSYILVFEVLEDVKGVKLKINDNISYVKGQIGAKNIFVSLNLKNIDENIDVITKKTGEKFVFEDNVLSNSSLIIKNISIANKFKVKYNFCASSNNCYESTEYVTPKASGNYIKTLFKAEGDLVLNSNILGVSNINDFLNMFGSIQYEKNGQMKTVKINSEFIKPQIAEDNNVYIEIPRESLDAEKINLIIKVRQKSYIYKIK